jgi:hypothetical protein
MGGGHGRTEAPLMVAWELTREGKEKGKERRGKGRGLGGAARGRHGAVLQAMGGAASASCALRPCWCCPCSLFLRERNTKEKGEEKKKRKEKKKKNMKKILNLKIFEK